VNIKRIQAIVFIFSKWWAVKSTTFRNVSLNSTDIFALHFSHSSASIEHGESHDKFGHAAASAIDSSFLHLSQSHQK